MDSTGSTTISTNGSQSGASTGDNTPIIIAVVIVIIIVAVAAIVVVILIIVCLRRKQGKQGKSTFDTSLDINGTGTLRKEADVEMTGQATYEAVDDVDKKTTDFGKGKTVDGGFNLGTGKWGELSMRTLIVTLPRILFLELILMRTYTRRSMRRLASPVVKMRTTCSARTTSRRLMPPPKRHTPSSAITPSDHVLPARQVTPCIPLSMQNRAVVERPPPPPDRSVCTRGQVQEEAEASETVSATCSSRHGVCCGHQETVPAGAE